MHCRVTSQGIVGGKCRNFALTAVKYRAVKMYRGVKVYLHSFLNSKLDRGGRLMQTLVPLITGEDVISRRSDVEAKGKKISISLCNVSNTGSHFETQYNLPSEVFYVKRIVSL
jgi:hypothetical protein